MSCIQLTAVLPDPRPVRHRQAGLVGTVDKTGTSSLQIGTRCRRAGGVTRDWGDERDGRERHAAVSVNYTTQALQAAPGRSANAAPVVVLRPELGRQALVAVGVDVVGQFGSGLLRLGVVTSTVEHFEDRVLGIAMLKILS